MRKEMFLAVIIGLALGLFITYGIYTARTAGRRVNPNETAPPTASGDSETTNSNLAVISPADESVQTAKALTVTGTTLADAFVVIFINDQEVVTTSDNSGNFSVQTELEPGSNIVAVHVIDEDGKTSTVERTVVYLTDALQTVGPALPASGSAQKSSPSPTTKVTPKVSPRPSSTPAAQ